jgi:hypothetical protein
MGELRTSMRLTTNELTLIRGLVQDALVRLAELNDGHDVALFTCLPTTETASADSTSVASFSNGENVDLDEQMVAYGGIKDWGLLEENGFDQFE